MCFWNYIVVFPFFAERYLAEMQDMNKAIKNASNIRPLLRELDGLREELSILMTMTTPETSRHPNDTRQIQKLLERAKEVKSTIRRDFQIALTVKKELGQVTGFQQKKILKRRQMLENEMKEATPFVDRAKTVYTDIRQVCRAAISDYRTQPVSEERLTIRPWPSGRHHHEMHGMARPDCLTTRGSKYVQCLACRRQYVSQSRRQAARVTVFGRADEDLSGLPDRVRPALSNFIFL